MPHNDDYDYDALGYDFSYDDSDYVCDACLTCTIREEYRDCDACCELHDVCPNP